MLNRDATNLRLRNYSDDYLADMLGKSKSPKRLLLMCGRLV